MTSAQWNDDKFTKMLKEEAQNIRFITDKELKKVEDYLHKTTELSELYTSFDSKKKTIVQSSANIIDKSKAAVLQAAAIAVLSAGEENSENAGSERNNTEQKQIPDSTDSDADGKAKKKRNNYKIEPISDVKVNRTQAEYVMRAIGRDKWDKLKEQFKDNLESMLIEFLSNGPGMMDFKVFNGVYGIIKSPLSDSFSRDVYEFYTSQKSFAEAYRVLVRAFGTSNNNMANTLDIMASRIAAAKDVDSTDREIVTTFISAVKLVVAIIYNNNLRPKLKKAFENSTNNPKIYESLVAFYNEIEDISDNKRNNSGELNFIGLKEVAGKIYPNTVAAKNLNGINAIAALFLIISTAISKGKMEMEYDLSEAEDTYDNRNTSLDISSIMYDNLVDEIFGDIDGPKKIDIIDDPTLGQTPYQLKVVAGQLQLKDINGKSIFITGRLEWNKAVQAAARERSHNDFSYKFVRKLLELVDESTEPKQKRIEFVALLLQVSIENGKFIEDNRK